MSSYNLMKAEDRAQYKRDHLEELNAIESGLWPRDINDIMRWTPPYGMNPIEHARRMCQEAISYVDGLESYSKDKDHGSAIER